MSTNVKCHASALEIIASLTKNPANTGFLINEQGK